MIEHKVTSLQFGRVIVESGVIRTRTVIYSDDFQSASSSGSIEFPLDEVPTQLRERDISALDFAESVLKSAKKILDDEYPGGYHLAAQEFASWIENN